MPFYTIDWARYVNHADVRGAVDASTAIDGAIEICVKIWKYSGSWFGYKLSKKHRWIGLCHKLVLLTLILCTMAAAALSFRYWRPLNNFDANTIQRVTLTLTYWQCAWSSVALFYWQMKKRFKGFAKLLNAATMGIGLMKQKQPLRRVQYFILGCFGFWAFLFTIFHTLGTYTSPNIIKIPYPWKSFFWNRALQPLSLFILTYAAFGWFMAHVILTSYYSFLAAELHSLNADLRADSNLFQVAVLKHYTLIYHRLTHVNRHLNLAFGPLLTVTTSTNYFILILYSILFFIASDRLELADVVFGLVTVVFASSYLIAFSFLAVRLKRKGEYFHDVVRDVVAMDWNLDAEYHPVAACNAIYSKSVSFGLTFGTSWAITGQGLVKVMLTTLLVVILILFK